MSEKNPESILRPFHIFTYGPETGRKWVFLHGLMGFAANWRKIIAGLESTERCLAYDQRGHGRSFQPPTGYAPEDYADDLLKIVDALGWSRFILVGHSMGGRNALNFAARFPERVEKLVVEDIGPEVNLDSVPYYQKLLGLVPTPFANRAEAKEFLLHQFVRLAQNYENPEALAQYFYANMADQPDGRVDWRFWKPGILESVEARNSDRWQDVKSLKVPTLLIRGGDSRDLKPEIYQEMLDANKMIKGVVIPQAGHWVHSDQPQAVIAALKDFVGGF